MACCQYRGAAMSYRGDYRQRRLLTGHFITVTGGEQGERRRRKRRAGLKKKSEKNTVGGDGRKGTVSVPGRAKTQEVTSSERKNWITEINYEIFTAEILM